MPCVKRVTFDLGVEDSVAGNIEDGNTELDDVGDPEDVTEPFEEDAPKSHYVVADLEALLAEFELIDKFVQSDECILLIPAHIFRAIESTGVDISAPRNSVIAARQITRHIARQDNNNETNILVQTEETDGMDTCDPDGDPTLNSCLKLYNNGHHVMLITNNPDLNIQAKSFDLECYTTEEIREYISTPKPVVSFDIQKVGNTDDTSGGNCQPKVNGPKNNLFDKPDTSNQFFLNKPHEESEINNDESVQIKSPTIVNHRNPFLDKDDDLLEETQFKIKNLKLQEKTDNLKLQEKINNLKMQLKIDSQKLQERMNRRKLKEKFTSENLQESFKNQKYLDMFDNQKLKERISNHDMQMKFHSQKLKGRIESQQLQERLDDSKMKEIIDNHQMQQIKDNLKMLEGRDNLNKQAKNDNQKKAVGNTTFDNEFEPKEDHLTAKNKIKSINVYNLEGLLKSFSMKSKEMEERIVARMDEYMCWFRQIMEDVLEDIVKDVPGRQCEDQTKTIIQNQLSLLREIVTDHRTASALTDKLIAVMDRAFLPAKFAPDSELCGRPMLLNTRRALRLNANDFVKLFACGTLLVKVLRSIADDASLQDGESLLEQLEHSLEKWEFEPEPNTPVTPGTAAEPRPEFKRHRGEVILYLMKNLPQWKNYIPNDNEIPPDRLQEAPKVTEKVTPKVISTCGKNVGLLKLNPKKPIQFDDNQENQIKNNDNAKKDVSNNINAKIEGNEVIKSKAIREIGFDSFKPHKVKEIDVAKRENDDKELTEMLEQMMKKQPLTKSYDLKTIIIDKDESNEDNYKSFENSSKIKTNEDLKLKTAKQTHQNTNFKKYNTAKSTSNNATDKNEEKKENKTVYKITDLDLDVLDYSEIEEDEEEVNEDESIDEYSSNRLVIVESDHCNDVTTTHHEQEDTPNIEQNNDINNKNDINNENISNEIYIWNSSGIDKENDVEFDNEADEENCDSGIDSCEAYSLVQLFLSKLRETFLIIKVFIEESVTELNYDMDEGSMNVLNQQVDVAQGSVNNIINNLNNIIDRESNPDSALMPTLLKGVPEAETDKRIIKYRRVISKWLSQARVLQRSLQILQRIAQRNLQVRDLSDVSDNYSNLFE
ncbi:hypothetical protein O0L34_g12193 [Tuta absoluta]|nr:hypothetical protein O0L34_g12193 [Tuta absoluta]